MFSAFGPIEDSFSTLVLTMFLTLDWSQAQAAHDPKKKNKAGPPFK